MIKMIILVSVTLVALTICKAWYNLGYNLGHRVGRAEILNMDTTSETYCRWILGEIE